MAANSAKTVKKQRGRPLTNEQRAKGGRTGGGGRPTNAAKAFWKRHEKTAHKKFLALLKCGDSKVERDVAQYIIEKNEGKIADKLRQEDDEGRALRAAVVIYYPSAEGEKRGKID